MQMEAARTSVQVLQHHRTMALVEAMHSAGGYIP